MASTKRELKDDFRFLIGLGGVAVGAAVFAVAFRLSLAWLYRSLYDGDNVVDGITNLPLLWRFCLCDRRRHASPPRGQPLPVACRSVARGR